MQVSKWMSLSRALLGKTPISKYTTFSPMKVSLHAKGRLQQEQHVKKRSRLLISCQVG
jgi:hypothetical protein